MTPATSGSTRATKSSTPCGSGPSGRATLSEAAARIIPAAAKFAEQVAHLQDVLGEQHDAVVAEGWLRDTVTAGVSGDEGMVAGLLIASQRAEAASRREEWRSVWKELDQRKLRSWMGAHG